MLDILREFSVGNTGKFKSIELTLDLFTSFYRAEKGVAKLFLIMKTLHRLAAAQMIQHDENTLLDSSSLCL